MALQRVGVDLVPIHEQAIHERALVFGEALSRHEELQLRSAAVRAAEHRAPPRGARDVGHLLLRHQDGDERRRFGVTRLAVPGDADHLRPVAEDVLVQPGRRDLGRRSKSAHRRLTPQEPGGHGARQHDEQGEHQGPFAGGRRRGRWRGGTGHHRRGGGGRRPDVTRPARAGPPERHVQGHGLLGPEVRTLQGQGDPGGAFPPCVEGEVQGEPLDDPRPAGEGEIVVHAIPVALGHHDRIHPVLHDVDRLVVAERRVVARRERQRRFPSTQAYSSTAWPSCPPAGGDATASCAGPRGSGR